MCPSLLLELFRKGFKIFILRTILKWLIFCLSDYFCRVYWFYPILSVSCCVVLGCFMEYFSPSSFPPLLLFSASFCLPYPTPLSFFIPQGTVWSLGLVGMTSVDGCQNQGLLLVGMCNVVPFVLSSWACAPGTQDHSVNVYWMSKSLPSQIHALPPLIAHSWPLFLVHA